MHKERDSKKFIKSVFKTHLVPYCFKSLKVSLSDVIYNKSFELFITYANAGLSDIAYYMFVSVKIENVTL